MSTPTDLSQPIIEALYCEALVLADEVRSAFDLAPARCDQEDLVRIALSVEGLRTTTRMMHLLAWLLNHRAYFAGDLSDFQLRRHGVLPPDRAADPENLVRLERETCALIAETESLHRRIARLDAAWRERFVVRPAAVHRLREQLGRALSSL
jgi:regulator of CtrA degradation